MNTPLTRPRPMQLAGPLRWILPVTLVLLFLAVLLWLPWQARQMESNERQEQLIADTLWVEQAVRFELDRNAESAENLAAEICKDQLSKVQPVAVMPNQQTMLEALLRDSAFKYIDNINTPETETLYDVVTLALNKAMAMLYVNVTEGTLEWSKHKSPRIYHLLRTSVMPFSKAIPVGGNSDVINATTTTHGPSWRMIVQLSQNTEAYAVYPGGQSGNPGSRFYDNFVDAWVKGEYYTLWMMKRNETADKKIKWTMSFSNQ
mgnify:CR=1 FL=1